MRRHTVRVFQARRLLEPERLPSEERGRMRSWVVGTTFGAALLASPGARAGSPCIEDVKQFCADVPATSSAVEACLHRNEEKLSTACREKRAKTEAAFHALIEEFSTACRSDATRLCSEVKPGHGRVVACLIRQQDDLSRSCHALTDRVQSAAETIDNMRKVCGAEATRLCAGVPPQAGPLVECLQTNRENLSPACGSLDPRVASAAAELVDAVDSLSTQERSQEAQQILQGIETIAFSRSQVLFQVDSYQGINARANGNRLLFNPQVAFGNRNQFAIQLKAPVFDIYPYAANEPARGGLGAVTTSFAWAFAGNARVRHYAAFGLQWISPVGPPVGSAWAVIPGYAISVGLLPWLSVTGQVAWTRSFASEGYPELNILLFDPIVVVSLPGRSFLAVDTKLGWDLGHDSFVPIVKGIAGIYVDRKRSLSISAWYQSALTNQAELQTFKFGVGTALAYFFDW